MTHLIMRMPRQLFLIELYPERDNTNFSNTVNPLRHQDHIEWLIIRLCHRNTCKQIFSRSPILEKDQISQPLGIVTPITLSVKKLSLILI
jgi:hypothetical protein